MKRSSVQLALSTIFGGTTMSKRTLALLSLTVALRISALAADLPGSKDPPGMKRYEGSEIIAYREPRFDEFLVPMGAPTSQDPPKYTKSVKVEGLVSRYTYIAPAGRTPTELLRNYKLEFQRMDLVTLYEKPAGAGGWFGPTLSPIAVEDKIGDILAYNQDQERVLVGRTKDASPTYYYIFVTSYRAGNMPDRLQSRVTKDSALAEIVVVTPQQMEKKMVFVNADEMSRSLVDSGKIALYGIYFDTDKDSVRPDSQPTLQEIAKLLAANRSLRVSVVGHTDNQGKPDYNLDLSRRRAAAVVRELTLKYGIAADRLSSFGCGFYAPVASNDAEDGKAKNRRVELVKW
jgi:outer membrane protein OmpA-like peptidoglycan-associated protein